MRENNASGRRIQGSAKFHKELLKMSNTNDIVILSGNVGVKNLLMTTYRWSGRIDGDRELEFKKAYEIYAKDWDEGIVNCIYSIHGRKFQNLSCMEGNTLQEIQDDDDHYEVREHADGTKFVFSWGSIPTFDFGDREWDSMYKAAIYADAEGIHMISCSHGYRIPRIKVYIGLVRSFPALAELLSCLGCGNKPDQKTNE